MASRLRDFMKIHKGNEQSDEENFRYWIITTIAAALLLLRFAYMRWHPDFLDKIRMEGV